MVPEKWDNKKNWIPNIFLIFEMNTIGNIDTPALYATVSFFESDAANDETDHIVNFVSIQRETLSDVSHTSNANISLTVTIEIGERFISVPFVTMVPVHRIIRNLLKFTFCLTTAMVFM